MLIDKRRHAKPVKNFINQMGQTAKVTDMQHAAAEKKAISQRSIVAPMKSAISIASTLPSTNLALVRST